MPEHGLYKVLNASLFIGARVLEIKLGKARSRPFSRATRGSELDGYRWSYERGELHQGLVDYHDVCSPWPPQWNLVDGRRPSITSSLSVGLLHSTKCEPNFTGCSRRQARRSSIGRQPTCVSLTQMLDRMRTRGHHERCGLQVRPGHERESHLPSHRHEKVIHGLREDSRRLSDMSVQGASFLHLAMVMELMHLLSFNIHDSTLFDVRLDYA